MYEACYKNVLLHCRIHEVLNGREGVVMFEPANGFHTPALEAP